MRTGIERTEQRRADTGIRPWAELAARRTQARTPLGWERQRRQLQEDVQALCQCLLTTPGARRRTGRFAAAEQPVDPAGARGLGCLIYFTAGDSGAARFWWRYAAGIGDATAAYLLVLEALLRGDHREAAHCYRALGADGALYDEDLDEPVPDAGTARPPFLRSTCAASPAPPPRHRLTRTGARRRTTPHHGAGGERCSLAAASRPGTAECPLAEQAAVGRMSRG
ncbi:hypothetical protein ABZ419_31725 [Streptomyces cinnamoneus]|uniref:hypothetical protein n=1 Tax=Streptomyces cinnamoneus TaxID=53446 RepID=UPI0033D8B30F